MSHELSAMNRKGFTIVELAVVLVLVGILIALGVRMIGPLTQRAKISETKGTIDAAIESLVGFAATNRRLPTVAEFTGAVKKPNDAWGNVLLYVVDTNLTTIPAGSTDTICGRKTTNLTVRSCVNAGCTTFTDTPNVAYIIFSGGANVNNQTAATGAVSSPPPVTTVNIYDTGLNVDNYAGDLGGARVEPVDDIARWVTLNELRTKIGCAGQQLKILNNELPSGTTGAYSADIYATEGVPFGTSPNTYRWCVNTLPTTGLQLSAGAITAADCSTATTWGTATDRLTISKHPTNLLASNSYQITIVVRDNSGLTGALACNNVNNRDNCTQKSFVITISP